MDTTAVDWVYNKLGLQSLEGCSYQLTSDIFIDTNGN